MRRSKRRLPYDSGHVIRCRVLDVIRIIVWKVTIFRPSTTCRSARTNAQYVRTDDTYMVLASRRSLLHWDFFIGQFDVQCRLAFDCHRRLASLRSQALMASLRRGDCKRKLVIYAISFCMHSYFAQQHAHRNACVRAHTDICIYADSFVVTSSNSIANAPLRCITYILRRCVSK